MISVAINYDSVFKDSLYGRGGVQSPSKSVVERASDVVQPSVPSYAKSSPLNTNNGEGVRMSTGGGGSPSNKEGISSSSKVSNLQGTVVVSDLGMGESSQSKKWGVPSVTRTSGIRTVVYGRPDISQASAERIKESIRGTSGDFSIEDVNGGYRIVSRNKPSVVEGRDLTKSKLYVNPLNDLTPSERMLLSREELASYDTMSQLEASSPGASKRLEEARVLAEFKASSGEEIPLSLGQSFLYSAFNILPKGKDDVFKRTEEWVNDVLPPIPSKYDLLHEERRLIRNTFLGEDTPKVKLEVSPIRKDIINFGSYLVPGYGSAKFSNDIFVSASNKKVGEALLLSSIPYVGKGVVVAVEKDVVKSTIKGVEREMFKTKLNRKFSGALSTELGSDELARANEFGLVLKGREVKGVSFGTVLEADSKRKVFRYEFNYGKEQIIPKVESVDFYKFSYSGEKVFGDVTQSISGSKNVGKRVAEELFRTENLGKYVSVDGTVSGKGTFTGLRFSDERGLVNVNNPKRLRPKLLERSKPLNEMQSGIIVEKGLAIRPDSNYRLDRFYEDLNIVKISKPKSMKLFKVSDVVVSPKVESGSVLTGGRSSGGSELVSLLKTEKVVEEKVKVKSESVSVPLKSKSLGDSRFSNMFSKSEVGYVPGEEGKVLTGVGLNSGSLSEFIAKTKSGTSLKFGLKSGTKILSVSKVGVAQGFKTSSGSKFDVSVKSVVVGKAAQLSKFRSESLSKSASRFDSYKSPKSRSELIEPVIKVPEVVKKKGVGESDFISTEGNSGFGFVAFLKRKGKFRAVSPVTSRLSALDIGTLRAKETLGATFKIEKVRGTPISVKTGNEFQKFRNEFRDYKIRGNQRIGLNDEFIQLEKFRLNTRSEVSEIQGARKNKSVWVGV
jgi:hypothetical protein